MKRSLILLLLLVLAACTPAPGHHLVTTEVSVIETSGGLIVVQTIS